MTFIYWVSTTFHGRSSSTRLEGHSGRTLRIWRRYASGSIPFRRQVPAFPATSRNLSAEAGIRGKNALPGHESPGHWSSNQSRFSQHGTNIFGEKLVTGSWSAQVQLITMELQNFLPCCIQKKAVVNFDWFSDENDDGDTQIRINEQ